LFIRIYANSVFVVIELTHLITVLTQTRVRNLLKSPYMD